METFKSILKFFNIISWPLCILLVVALCFVKCELNKSLDSIIVYEDSIRLYTDKNDRLVTESNAYLMDINTIKRVNEEYYQEIKKLKNNPIVFTKTVVQYIDTSSRNTTTTSIIDTSDTKRFDWEHKEYFSPNNHLTLGGYSTLSFSDDLKLKNPQTTINNISISSDAIISYEVDKNNNIVVTAKSNNPYITFAALDGFMINNKDLQKITKPKKKRFYVGFGVGYGIGLTSFKLEPQATISVGIKFIEF